MLSVRTCRSGAFLAVLLLQIAEQILLVHTVGDEPGSLEEVFEPRDTLTDPANGQPVGLPFYSLRRITDVCDLPLLVDIDTGFGPSAFNIARTVKSLIKAGAAACHIEDQVGAKRCGHRPGKEIVSCEEMVDRVRAAADAKTDPDFFLIARTDAIQAEGVDAAIERCQRYVEAGADGIFAEAAYDLPTYKRFVDALNVPVLANITEFGATPLFSRDELASVGVAIQLYPLSAFRAANKAAEAVYTSIRQNGHQKDVIELMQTRAELYDRIGYHAFEQKLDALFAAGKK